METDEHDTPAATRESTERAVEARSEGARTEGWFARTSPRERWSWALTVVGFAVILSGVFHLTGAAIGGRVHEFKDRRTYTQVKLATHRALPVTLLLAAAGGGLLLLGSRLRAAPRLRVAERPPETKP